MKTSLCSRCRHQDPPVWPGSEVRGQAGSSGAAGNQVQGNSGRTRNDATLEDRSRSNRRVAAGQQHDGRHPLAQGLPRRREARHRRHDRPGRHLRHPLPQQRAPGDALQIRGEEVGAGQRRASWAAFFSGS